VIPILLLAAADRFVNLAARGIWDMDQGFEMGAIWNQVLTRQLPTFGSPAFSIGGTFHHGALFYDLMIPVAWAGNGNPIAVVTAIALFGFVVVPLVWWTARSIGGTSAGLATALLAAISPSLIDYSTFLWNPVLIEAGVALACFGAWQAWVTHSPRWWVVAAAGTALASQSHLTGLALVFPMAFFFMLTLRLSPAGERRRLLAWGLAGVALFVLTWMPWIVYELTHNFAETRAILAFNQDSPAAADPFTRLFFSAIRILAWPMTHWPLSDFVPGFPVALAVAAGVIVGLVWRLAGALTGTGARGSGADMTGGSAGAVSRHEREGLIFIGGSLLLLTTLLGLGIKELSQVANVNQEQYHAVADVFVILAAGLVAGGLWRSAPLRGRPWSGHVLASLALAALVVVGIGRWPPLTAPDGGWPAAQIATSRLERDVVGGELALVPLPYFVPPDAYGYPLKLDGYKVVATQGASTIVFVCYPQWAKTCGEQPEADWMAANLPGQKFTLVDRFDPAPGRTLSIYRRAP
jgi:4-amino-4-deoxy-L-arabinose transferase-like glycosyltransferase